MKIRSFIFTLLLGMAGSVQLHAQASPDAALDALYKAGAEANTAAYTSLLTEDVVLLGFDGDNRYEGQSARDFVLTYFANGNTWTYISSQRDTRLSPDGSVAWFDELLQHEQLGRGRATGVLVRHNESWKIAQYNLTAPLPYSTLPASGAEGASPAAIPGSTNSPATGVEQEPRCKMIRHKTNTRASC